MNANVISIWRARRRVLCTLLLGITRSVIKSRPAALSGLFTPNRKPSKSEMSVELGMIPMLVDRPRWLLRVLLVAALWIMPAGARAQSSISVSEVSLRLSEATPNDLGASTSELIIVAADSVIPNGTMTATGGTTATAQTTDQSTGVSYGPYTFPFTPNSVSPNMFSLTKGYESYFTYPWTLTFTNASTLPTPFSSNVTESGTGLNPTFTWTYPISAETPVDAVEVLGRWCSRASRVPGPYIN
jgi:hypothetical protein